MTWVFFWYSLHFGCCLFMTAVIWLVQVVHYPSFRYVSTEKFIDFESFHRQRITWIVGPVMLLELGSFVLWILLSPSAIAWISGLSALGVLAFTFLVSVPIHNSLSLGFSKASLGSLVASNWVRTISWTARTVFLVLNFPAMIDSYYKGVL